MTSHTHTVHGPVIPVPCSATPGQRDRGIGDHRAPYSPHGDTTMTDALNLHRLLALIIHAKREKTGNPWWPLEPPQRISPESEAEINANIQITVAMRHNVGPTEADARLARAGQLARRAGNEHLAKQARRRRR